MLKMYYYPCRGGLGDSIIGLQSVYIFSKILNLDLKILNGPVKFFNYFDIPDNIKVENINQSNIISINYEPFNTDFNKYLQSENNFLKLKGNNILISSGSNFCQYLYLNKNITINIKQEDIIKILFQKIIIPKKNILNQLKSYKNVFKLENKICVHIRCNNKWNDSNSYEKQFKVVDTIKQFIKCIKYLTKEPILLITDNLEIVQKVFQENNIAFFTTPGEICHSLKSETVDYNKTLLDLLLIGETKKTIISYWSNFSRIGVLRSLNEVYAVNPILNINKEYFNYNINFNEEFKNIEHKNILFKESEKNE